MVTVSNQHWWSLSELFLVNKGHMFIVSSIDEVSKSAHHACSSRSLHLFCSSSDWPNICLSLWNARLVPLPVREQVNASLGAWVFAYFHKLLLTWNGPGQTGRLTSSRSQESGWCCKYRMRQYVRESSWLLGRSCFRLEMDTKQIASPLSASSPGIVLNLRTSRRCSVAQNVRPRTNFCA